MVASLPAEERWSWRSPIGIKSLVTKAEESKNITLINPITNNTLVFTTKENNKIDIDSRIKPKLSIKHGGRDPRDTKKRTKRDIENAEELKSLEGKEIKEEKVEETLDETSILKKNLKIDVDVEETNDEIEHPDEESTLTKKSDDVEYLVEEDPKSYLEKSDELTDETILLKKTLLNEDEVLPIEYEYEYAYDYDENTDETSILKRKLSVSKLSNQNALKYKSERLDEKPVRDVVPNKVNVLRIKKAPVISAKEFASKNKIVLLDPKVRNILYGGIQMEEKASKSRTRNPIFCKAVQGGKVSNFFSF